jgi:hypothetical protein
MQSETCLATEKDGKYEVVLPVVVGSVTGTGDSKEEAERIALEKQTTAQEFGIEAIRVRREILAG